ncbi:MAG: hypothetical protein Q4A74_01610 [Cardiobacteriaceae bacterium]|nr:hypothetical protein [Cardiobacteriaceae bacterium]
MATTEQEREQELLAHDISFLMSSEQGRRMVWRLLEAAQVYHTCFHDNALQMARREGRREQGLMLLDLVSNITPNEFLTMQQEALYERRERDARIRASGQSGDRHTAD